MTRTNVPLGARKVTLAADFCHFTGMKQFNGKAQPLRFSGAGRTHFHLHSIAIDPVCGFYPSYASLAFHFSLSVSNYDGTFMSSRS
jgi:hypothetical protein